MIILNTKKMEDMQKCNANIKMEVAILTGYLEV